MAIYGIGSHYGSTRDMSQDFIKHNCACVGWDQKDAPGLHRAINSLKIGDLIYIKSYPPNVGLIVRAIGIVTDNTAKKYQFSSDDGVGVGVKWIWQGDEKIQFDDKYNVHRNTFYEEFIPEVQDFILSKIN